MRKSTEALIETLNTAVGRQGGDWSIELTGGRNYAWSAEVRVTADANVRGAPDRSVVFFQTAGYVAEDALEPALRAAIAEVQTWNPDRERPARWMDPE